MSLMEIFTKRAFKTTESSSDSFLAVIKERIPTEIMEKIISLLFDEISKDNM